MPNFPSKRACQLCQLFLRYFVSFEVKNIHFTITAYSLFIFVCQFIFNYFDDFIIPNNLLLSWLFYVGNSIIYNNSSFFLPSFLFFIIFISCLAGQCEIGYFFKKTHFFFFLVGSGSQKPRSKSQVCLLLLGWCMLTPWKKSYDQPRQHIEKQRHYFADKGPSSQGYGFSSGHVWM